MVQTIACCLCSAKPLSDHMMAYQWLGINFSLKVSSAKWRSLCLWWRHQMEALSALPSLCAGKSPVIGEFPSQRPVTRSFDVFFDLRLNERLSQQSRRRCLRRHRAHYDVTVMNWQNGMGSADIYGMYRRKWKLNHRRPNRSIQNNQAMAILADVKTCYSSYATQYHQLE